MFSFWISDFRDCACLPGHGCQAALLELDPERLLARVTAAETAIFDRVQALSQGQDSHAERQAIERCAGGLTYSQVPIGSRGLLALNPHYTH